MNGQYPVMGNDVWEHAYYLEYQNRPLTISPRGGMSSTWTKLPGDTPRD